MMPDKKAFPPQINNYKWLIDTGINAECVDTREMQMKTTLRSHLSPVRLAHSWKLTNNT